VAKHYALDASHPSRSPSPYIGVSIGVRPASLLLGQGGDELAAEVGDVWDHAAPDQVGGGRKTLVDVSKVVLGRPRRASILRMVCSRV
jgi:hypothetical protein